MADRYKWIMAPLALKSILFVTSWKSNFYVKYLMSIIL